MAGALVRSLPGSSLFAGGPHAAHRLATSRAYGRCNLHHVLEAISLDILLE